LYWVWHKQNHGNGEEALFQAAQTTTVLVYSGLGNLLAIFTFLLLKLYGHQDVRLLDGDRSKWLAEDRPLSDQRPVFAPTIYRAPEPDGRLRALRSDVAKAIGQPGHLLPIDPTRLATPGG
jgi:thiosulfate/3-mercaptopyruvate sulfurtransferase